MRNFEIFDKLNDSDLGSIRKLFNSLGYGDDTEEAIKLLYQNTTFFSIAKIGETVVGSCRIISDGHFCSFIADIGVQEEYRGNGIGRALMRETIKHVKHTPLYTCSFKGTEEFFEIFGLKEKNKLVAQARAPIVY